MNKMKTTGLSDVSLLGVRIILSSVVAAHGAQKLLGWFGGFGFDGTMGFLQNSIGLPYVFSLLIILAESVGMVALVLGFASRLLSASIILIMLGAIVTTHLEHGFFMNWFGAQTGEGFEYHIVLIGLASVVMLNGAGSYSLDAYLQARLKQNGVANFLFA
jgi:putative oxidoreductase